MAGAGRPGAAAPAAARRSAGGRGAGALPAGDAGGEAPGAGLQRRAALASTLLAGLELEREGIAVMEQDGAFGRVRITPAGNTHALRPSMGVASGARG